MLATLQPGLAAIAARQRGLFTKAQATEAGYTDRQIQYQVSRGHWKSARRSVYCESRVLDATGKARFELNTLAVLLSLPDSVASHSTAALLFGIRDDIPNVVTVTRPPERTSSLAAPGATIRSAGLPATHTTSVRGVRVTTAARTVIDLARTQPFRVGVINADRALHLGLISTADLKRLLADCSGWCGLNLARQVVAFADPNAESPLESTGRVVFAEQGLPPPETQVEIRLAAGKVARVDFLWRRYATIVETDGMIKYTEPAVLWQEKLRQEALAELGYEVIRVTWRELHENPEAVARRIRQAFARGLARRRAAR